MDRRVAARNACKGQLVLTLMAELRAFGATVLPAGFPADTVVLFPPGDHAQAALRALIAAAAVSVKVEMYTYTDKTIDGILHAKAAQPGFEFQATFDSSQATQDPAMAALLAGWAADLGKRVVTGKSERGEIIHRKVWVIDHLYVASGSMNTTISGEVLEDNELVIRRSKPLAARYEQILDANFLRVQAAPKAASA